MSEDADVANSSRSRSGFRPASRIRHRSEFEPVFRSGVRSGTKLLLVVGRRNEHGRSRLGISAGRRLGNAVLRNRFKRRIRELFRRDTFLKGHGVDLIVHGHAPAGGADAAELARDFRACARSVVRRLGA